MQVICPTCEGTGHIDNELYGGPCYDCHGKGMRESNRDRRKADKKRRYEKRISDEGSPFVTIRVQLPMLERELDNVGEYGCISIRDIITVLEKHIVKEV